MTDYENPYLKREEPIADHKGDAVNISYDADLPSESVEESIPRKDSLEHNTNYLDDGKYDVAHLDAENMKATFISDSNTGEQTTGFFAQDSVFSHGAEETGDVDELEFSYDPDFIGKDFIGEEYRADTKEKSQTSSEVGNGIFSVDPAVIEAILMVATEPVLPSLLAELLETTVEAVEQACEMLAGEYAAQGRGFELVQVAGGYRYQSAAGYKEYVERFIILDMPQKLSPAAMETLAIIAYKQPISRAQIAAIRGVNVDRVVRILIQKGLIKEVAKDTGPGQAILFGTTNLFLERMGLNEITDLPPLEEHVPDAATVEALEHVLKDRP